MTAFNIKIYQIFFTNASTLSLNGLTYYTSSDQTTSEIDISSFKPFRLDLTFSFCFALTNFIFSFTC